jgi:hypothetical protein
LCLAETVKRALEELRKDKGELIEQINSIRSAVDDMSAVSARDVISKVLNPEKQNMAHDEHER